MFCRCSPILQPPASREGEGWVCSDFQWIENQRVKSIDKGLKSRFSGVTGWSNPLKKGGFGR